MVLPQRDQSLTWFLACFKKPTKYKPACHTYSAIVDIFMMVSFVLEKHYIPQYYRLLTCCVCARLCQCSGQGGCYFGCEKRRKCSNTRTQRFLLLGGCAYLTPSVNWLSGLKRASKINVGIDPGPGLWFRIQPGSGFKLRPFYNPVWVSVQKPTRGDWKDASSSHQQ